MKNRFVLPVVFAAVSMAFAFFAWNGKGQPTSNATVLAASRLDQDDSERDHKFRVTSPILGNDQAIPASMVFNGTLGSVCTGGNESPQLSWTRGRRGTRSYVVALFDVTANFAHWGVYNVPVETTELAAGAGDPTNTTLQQVYNDAGIQGYTGPCPPPDLVPNGIHRYVFTVYALDTMLDLAQSPDFPPGADALYRAMNGHVIDQASITGLFSCSDASSCS